MIKFQAVGFALVMAIVVAAVDYSKQAQRAGLTMSQLGINGYVDSIKGRYGFVLDQRALRERQKQLAKIHLPQAPEGWTRREWAEGDNTRIAPPTREMTEADAVVIDALNSSPLTSGLMAADAKAAARAKEREIWVYERGDEIISIRAVFRETDTSNSVSGLAIQIALANMQGMSAFEGYALIKGVAYGESMSWSQSMVQDSELDNYRKLSAQIGENIKLSVRARASDETIRSLLAQIDYDGLNAMLDQPLRNIGSDAPEVDSEQQAEMAGQILERQQDEVQQAGQAAEEKMLSLGDAIAAAAGMAGIATEDPETAPNKIEPGMKPVVHMPGQDCEQRAGSKFCGFGSD